MPPVVSTQRTCPFERHAARAWGWRTCVNVSRVAIARDTVACWERHMLRAEVVTRAGLDIARSVLCLAADGLRSKQQNNPSQSAYLRSVNNVHAVHVR